MGRDCDENYPKKAGQVGIHTVKKMAGGGFTGEGAYSAGEGSARDGVGDKVERPLPERVLFLERPSQLLRICQSKHHLEIHQRARSA